MILRQCFISYYHFPKSSSLPDFPLVKEADSAETPAVATTTFFLHCWDWACGESTAAPCVLESYLCLGQPSDCGFCGEEIEEVGVAARPKLKAKVSAIKSRVTSTIIGSFKPKPAVECIQKQIHMCLWWSPGLRLVTASSLTISF